MTNKKQQQQQQRQQALKKAEEAYQDRKSPHYRDNKRFSWAVETINRKFFEDLDYQQIKP